MIRQIQKRRAGSDAIPLVLFHDASGTISSYYGLGSLGRDVYAIADPQIGSDKHESLTSMSRRYYAAIKKIIPEGRILVGGWSLGGMIALQVAWIFARDTRTEVVGVIMVDSPFPAYLGLLAIDLDSPTSEHGPDQARNQLEKAMLRTVNMLQDWRTPVWRQKQRPATVMLCAKQCVACESQPALGLIDQFRDSPTLGWNERAGSLIDKSYSIEGQHFDIFQSANVSAVSLT
ncbi:hypothetical protein M409DRAFT_38353 [Zasmidium cellare ATCC 36951]|uniref:Thioesterase domain-containing protein n=1 Tax=Zasmidium cellare ATCC 36951 TaxID=1080233 RepID=A0A6A6BW96_ZASCE|nr:uncharacterized protein M409DRAFT_38353 [Zasmidium cellare ATCC 36951]KAF2158308.1 hypothetical protein M409DRAFT_38353 [Zasmidium cellare ATCC 36951]